MDVLKLKNGRQTKRIIPDWKDYSRNHFGYCCICFLAGLQDVSCNRGTGGEELSSTAVNRDMENQMVLNNIFLKINTQYL
jgi:hypothetical protein